MKFFKNNSILKKINFIIFEDLLKKFNNLFLFFLFMIIIIFCFFKILLISSLNLNFENICMYSFFFIKNLQNNSLFLYTDLNIQNFYLLELEIRQEFYIFNIINILFIFFFKILIYILLIHIFSYFDNFIYDYFKEFNIFKIIMKILFFFIIIFVDYIIILF